MTNKTNASYLRSVLIELTDSLSVTDRVLKTLAEMDLNFNKIKFIRKGNLTNIITLKGNPKGFINIRL